MNVPFASSSHLLPNWHRVPTSHLQFNPSLTETFGAQIPAATVTEFFQPTRGYTRHVRTITGESYRLREKRRRGGLKRSPPPQAEAAG